MSVLLLLGGLAAGAGVLAVACLVPARTATGWAVGGSLWVGAIVVNNSVPKEIRVPAMMLCALLILVGGARGALRVNGRGVLGVLLGWLLLAVVGVVVNRSQTIQGTVLYFGLLALLAVACASLNEIGRVIVLRNFLALACVQVGISVATQLMGIAPMWGYRGDLERENPFFDMIRAQGTLGHPLVMGFVMALAGLIAWNGTAARLGRRIRLGAIVVSGAGLALSGTRSAVLAAVAAVAVHLLLRSNVAAWLRNSALFAGVSVIILVSSTGLWNVIANLIASGSWTHRMDSLSSVPALMGRPLAEATWGSGFGSQTSLFDQGLIPLSFGLKVVDDFVVYLLGTMGVVGLALFVTVCVVAFIRADRLGKSLIAACAVMCFSFDVVVWLYTGMILMVCLTGLIQSPASRNVRTLSSNTTSANHHRDVGVAATAPL